MERSEFRIVQFDGDGIDSGSVFFAIGDELFD